MYPDSNQGTWSSGAFYQKLGYVERSYRVSGGGNEANTYFDISRIVPTSNENRPFNVSLLPCIKY